LREWDPKETSKMTKLADMYLEARLHREWNREKKHKESSYKKPSKESERGNERRIEDEPQPRINHLVVVKNRGSVTNVVRLGILVSIAA